VGGRGSDVRSTSHDNMEAATPVDWLATTATPTTIADRLMTKKLMRNQFVYF